MSDVLVKGKYLLYSVVECRMLMEIALAANSVFDYVTIEISEDGLEFTMHDRAMICQVDFSIEAELFEEYQAVKGSIDIDSRKLTEIVKDMGTPKSTAGFMIEPDRILIYYDGEEEEIPKCSYSRTHLPKPVEHEVTARYVGDFLQNILKLIGDDIVEIGMAENGPITVTRKSYCDKLVVSYSLAPMKDQVECELL